MSIKVKNTAVTDILWGISDPEIPVLSIMDMGIVREIKETGNEVMISITPTYSGCPAMDTIKDDIDKALTQAGFKPIVNLVLTPAWTTDWITEEGRKKLADYGIAPPLDAAGDKSVLLHGKKIIKCPQCGSENTVLVSQFGSTACKALFKCEDCLEPFDYFKCL
ncbi:1,2-phenylacetyl-CoA epoxidase subunit PaaD [Fulvivirgaceae bacterium BMA12]|uniref:1,2-phenylacetyl-CoA epoxidase subunit PaaD n=1 Tax=Agaribacillus aureus TaxID=3051825 RepID=A0ABT8LFQ3_9BACT|nr:1,2-phenylacetyl-CoA epoxidase subunit PaaD [Fulvivirgaceae bacterium BMA12]